METEGEGGSRVRSFCNDRRNLIDRGEESVKVSAIPRAKKTAEEAEMADEAERFASHRELWEYKRGKTCGSFTDISKQLTNPLSFFPET
jgi:endogenous inhibitor of DNA gyrase (YacG/DUF329 family)